METQLAREAIEVYGREIEVIEALFTNNTMPNDVATELVQRYILLTSDLELLIECYFPI